MGHGSHLLFRKVLFLYQQFSGLLSSVRIQAVDSTTSKHFQRNDGDQMRKEQNVRKFYKLRLPFGQRFSLLNQWFSGFIWGDWFGGI